MTTNTEHYAIDLTDSYDRQQFKAILSWFDCEKCPLKDSCKHRDTATMAWAGMYPHRSDDLGGLITEALKWPGLNAYLDRHTTLCWIYKLKQNTGKPPFDSFVPAPKESIHFIKELGNDCVEVPCGVLGAYTGTNNPERVTCKKCLEKLQ